MAFIILSLITALALFIILGISVAEKKWRIRPRQLLSLLGCFWLLFGMFAIVPTGHTGILTTFGRVEDTTLEAGLHFKLPVQEVVVMDNRTQKSVVDLSCFSSDIQEVSVRYSINYQIQKSDAQNIYKTIGEDYYNVVMQPRIEVAVRSVIAKYTAETLIENRETLSSQITDILLNELSVYNIDVVNTAIEDMDFSDVFTQAVEAKQVAQQEKLKAETEQEQKTMEEQAAADRQVITAQANAEVAKIEAEADREVLKIQADAAEYAGQKDAAVNTALAESLTDILLEYYAIKQWDGQMPEYLAGMDEGGILALIYGLQHQSDADKAPTATDAPAAENGALPTT
jgi:regulator of protease activity HflC (stomatin/prohibitin superfamily)